MKTQFSQFYEKIKGKKLKKDQLLILVLVGILLLVVAIPTKPSTSREKEAGTDNPEQSQDGGAQNAEKGDGEAESGIYDSYVENMERRLENTLSYVEGVGRVKVMITLKDKGEKIVEKDRQETSSASEEADAAGGVRTVNESGSGEETVYADWDGAQRPYITREIEPEVEGIIVIAQGGRDAVVMGQITEAVQALFPVEAHKIKIMKMR